MRKLLCSPWQTLSIPFALICYAATQAVTASPGFHQERTQVVCSMGWPGSARLEGTPAMDLGKSRVA